MNGYHVRVHRRARRELSSSPDWLRKRVTQLFSDLSVDPVHGGWDIAEVHGEKGFYRVRIGDYRIVYRVDEADRVIYVERVAPRGDAYAD